MARAPALVVMAVGLAGSVAAQPTPPGAGSADVMQTVRAIVRAGQSAGVVVRLDRAGRSDGSSALFDLDESAPHVPPVPALGATAQQRLARHVARGPRFQLTRGALVDTSARSCARLLERRLAIDVSDHFFQVAVAAFNAATRRDIPKGVVGTCVLGAARGTSETVRVRRARTLGAALEEIVDQVSGVVWLAVEAADGRCAVGLYSRDTPLPGAPPRGPDLFCAVQIAVVAPQPVRLTPRRR